MRVTVIDYKAGNLASVVKALRYLGADVRVADSPEPINIAERIVLPGVGHFAATQRLDDAGVTPAIREAISHGIPFLGICVGMQWLMEGSAEAPGHPGFGYFQGRCERFPEGAEKVPHVGWNGLKPNPGSQLLEGVASDDYAYFTHSYRVPINAYTAAETEYLGRFASAVEAGNVMGVQFHPEKSGETGLKILRNFLEAPSC
ncbi:MAG TPA: imidazole glycerol phosphate synthase subunit HisH [Acidobacteriaceae bacterium]